MTVRKDDIMSNVAATDDQDFDALLDASSLGAPHVLAENASLPADVLRRLAKATAPERNTRSAVEAGRSENAAEPAADHGLLPLFLGLPRPLRTPTWGRDGFGTELYLLTGPTFDTSDSCSRNTPSGPMLWRSSLRCSDSTWPHVPAVPRVPRLLSPQPARIGNWFVCARPGVALPRWSGSALSDLSRSAVPIVTPPRLGPHPAVPPGIERGILRTAALMRDIVRRHNRLLDERTVPILPQRLSASSVGGRHLLESYWNAAGVFDPGRVSSPSVGEPFCLWLPVGLDRAELVRLASPVSVDGICLPRALRRPASSAVASADREFRRACSLQELFTSRSIAEGEVSFPVFLGSGTASPSRESAQFPQLRMWAEQHRGHTIRHADMRMRVHRSETDLGHAVAARFTYRPYDPYAIEAVFHPGDPSEKVWHFARDLLVDGLEGSAGEGDVMVWHDRRPSCETRESSIFIRLVSDEGTALLSAPRAHLQEYVVVTLRAVATGTEHEFLDGELNDLDGELVQLTCGGLGD